MKYLLVVAHPDDEVRYLTLTLTLTITIILMKTDYVQIF